MFTKARLRLTGWYLMIIMAITLFFSLVVYGASTTQLDQIAAAQRREIEQRLTDPYGNPTLQEEEREWLQGLQPRFVTEAKQKIVTVLLIVDAGILIISSIAGFFLAGRTLQPIKIMIDEQNQFVTDASHELRTPLTVLKSEIEVNLRDKDLSLKDAKAVLQSNLEEVNNLQLLSDNLIKLIRYQKNPTIGQIETVPLKKVVQEAVKKMNKPASLKKITFTTQIDDSKDMIILGNKSSLIELTSIFLDNAIKYSPTQTEIVISAFQTDHHLGLTITDQGIGIKKEDLPHLFDRFYRADQSRSKDIIPGYGLGLSIAKQIMDSYKGTIEVDSKENHGTTFTLNFPKSTF